MSSPVSFSPVSSSQVKVIGAGLAGSEAAWQCARRGLAVELYEMRPTRSTPAHETADFAELVCSNSLKSESENTAPWLLKEEMRRSGSLLLELARQTSVPAGHALAVDRAAFARLVTERLSREPLITIKREEVTRIDEQDALTIVATGPLTSEALSNEIARLCRDGAGPAQEADQLDGCIATTPAESEHEVLVRPNTPTLAKGGRTWGTGTVMSNSHLYFYDSISPIVEAESIDMDRVYLAARYDKGTADYINCPFTREEYDCFYDALIAAESVEPRDWEKLKYFEGCLPIEEIARRGRDTLRFGPMKPVGLRDPRTGQQPWAVLQLRQENLRADSYNLVGFQNHLRFPEQQRVFRLIPGLENARFLRYGQIHRNTYLNSPALLTDTLRMKAHPRVLFAGQISGVEGYVESIATGMLAGVYAAALLEGATPLAPPRETALGSLVHYITHSTGKKFEPANITFDLLPPLELPVAPVTTGKRPRKMDRQERHRLQCERALGELQSWLAHLAVPAIPPAN